MSGIYQVYTMIINFLGFPDADGPFKGPVTLPHKGRIRWPLQGPCDMAP